MSEIFPVVAADQYAERTVRHLTPCTPSPSVISKRQLPASSAIVRYTLSIRRFIQRKI